MMEIKFLKDFRGKETDEVFYLAGSVVGVKDHHAEHLIALGFAEEWKDEVFSSPEPVPAPEEKHEEEHAAPVVEPPPDAFVTIEKPKHTAKPKAKK